MCHGFSSFDAIAKQNSCNVYLSISIRITDSAQVKGRFYMLEFYENRKNKYYNLFSEGDIL